jgi:hypothetical protein
MPRACLPPATLDRLRARGVTHARVMCNEYRCNHAGRVSLDAIKLPGSTALASVRFKCSGCGGRNVNAVADEVTASQARQAQGPGSGPSQPPR